MLKHRLLMSALLIPATIALFVWDHHLGEMAPILFALLLLLSARATWEVVTLVRTVGFRPNLVMCCTASWMLLVVTWWAHLPHDVFIIEKYNLAVMIESRWDLLFGMLSIIFIVFFVSAMIRYPLTSDVEHGADDPVSRGRHIGTLGTELFAVAYVGLLLSWTSQLRWLGKGAIEGYFAVGALVVATKTGDIGAYTFGRLIGGAKMAPKLSPGKTWAGGVGHLATAGLCSVAWLTWLGPKISTGWLAWSVVPACQFGVVVGFAGLIGDLFESLLKRDVGVKDAPALLPGFGGLLDLLDSILFAGPVAYGMWKVLA